MRTRTKVAVAATTIGCLIAGGAGIARAGSGGDSTDTPIPPSDLARGSAAALSHTGQGRVTGTEIGDEESLYEIEVTLDDGSQVDVQLDERFDVVMTMSDNETANDPGGQD